jgi:ABC-type dipeptide/oligopeptide/nickel transport system ATPase component
VIDREVLPASGWFTLAGEMATVLALFISNRSRRVRRETGIFLSESQNQKTWMPDARANASIYQFRQDQHRDDEDVRKVNPFLIDPAGTATILFSRTGHHEDIGGWFPQSAWRRDGDDLPESACGAQSDPRRRRSNRQPISAHKRISRGEARAEALELLCAVQIRDPEKRMAAYPHELSGGMCQRVMIAMAVSCLRIGL